MDINNVLFFSQGIVAFLLCLPHPLECCEGYKFDGNSKYYTEVPSDIPANSTCVDLSNNYITELPAGVFSHLDECLVLDLSYNQISLIENRAFTGLRNLQELELQGNAVTNLSSGVFSPLTYCTELYLYSNQISVIENGSFIGLSHLQTLWLSDNEISVIKDGAFTGLIHLQTLWLSDNLISVIEDGTFMGLNQLQALSLSRNEITHLASGVFVGLPECNSLFLNFNKISQIDNGAFTGLNHLQFLHLDNNNITHISDGAFIYLTECFFLDLTKNQISVIEDGAFEELNHLSALALGGNNMTTLDSKLFVEQPRPLYLYISHSGEKEAFWDCSTLCWIKQETTTGTISSFSISQSRLFLHEIYVVPLKVECIDGDWENLNCSKEGRPMTFLGLSLLKLNTSCSLSINFVHSTQHRLLDCSCQGQPKSYTSD